MKDKNYFICKCKQEVLVFLSGNYRSTNNSITKKCCCLHEPSLRQLAVIDCMASSCLMDLKFNLYGFFQGVPFCMSIKQKYIQSSSSNIIMECKTSIEVK